MKKKETGGKMAIANKMAPAKNPILRLVAPVASDRPIFPDDVL